MRITMLAKLYPPWIGGLESHVAELSAAIAREDVGTHVTAVVGQAARAWGVREEVDGVSVIRAGTVARVARTPIAPSIGWHVRATVPDILHVHSPYPWGELFAAPYHRRYRLVVSHYHDVVRQRRLGAAYRPIQRRLYERADRIVVWSQELVTSSPALAPFHHKILVSPGGIDTTPFRPSDALRSRACALRARLSPGKPLVLFVGRLVYYKGLSVLLRAMTAVDATLLIVGDGPLRATLGEAALSLGIADRVLFRTEVDDRDLPIHYQASDLLVLPSTEATETFGLVQVEAHLSGIPTVCTSLPTGVTSVTRDGETGFVVPPGDPSALAEAIRRLIGDDDLRRTMGSHAMVRAREYYDVRRCARDMITLYRQLVPLAGADR